MSYTPPSSTAVDFTKTGVAYTAPAYNAVDFSWLTDHIAESIGPVTQFGTPVLILDAFVDADSLGRVTQFGTPEYIGPHVCDATGFQATQFGAPTALLTQDATSLDPATTFGTPELIPTTVGFLATVFGTPTNRLTQPQIPQEPTYIPGDPKEVLVTGNPNVWNVYPYDTTASVSTDYGLVDVQTYEYIEPFDDMLRSLVQTPDNDIVQPGHTYECEVSFQLVPDSGLPTADFLEQSISLTAFRPSAIEEVVYYIGAARSGGDLDITLNIYGYDEDNITVFDEYEYLTYSSLPTSFSLYGGYSLKALVGTSGITVYIKHGATEALVGTLAYSYTPTVQVNSVYAASAGLKVNLVSVLNTDDVPTVEVDNRTIEAVLGTPSGLQYWKTFGLGKVTKFGTPSTAHNTEHTASGFKVTEFGTPRGIVTLSDNVFVDAEGFKATRFGTPSADTDVEGASSSINSTQFGMPVSGFVGRADSMISTVFGTPTLLTKGATSGFRSTAFGTPTQRRTQTASSVYRPTRFGTPTARQTLVYQTYGFNPVRFGQPSGVSRFNYDAASLGVVTQFGTPDALDKAGRAVSIPPVVNFGTPLMQRTPLC